MNARNALACLLSSLDMSRTTLPSVNLDLFLARYHINKFPHLSISATLY